MPAPLRVTAVIQRKHPRLPRFVVIPAARVAAWGIERTTIVEGRFNETELGRRSIKHWDVRRWWIDLPEPLCQRARVETGDRVTLELRIASDPLPEELSRLLARDPAAKRVWERLTPSRQRMLREHVAAAKQPATRERRPARVLGGC